MNRIPHGHIVAAIIFLAAAIAGTVTGIMLSGLGAF